VALFRTQLASLVALSRPWLTEQKVRFLCETEGLVPLGRPGEPAKGCGFLTRTTFMAFRRLLLPDGFILLLQHGSVCDQRQKMRPVWMLEAMVPSQITGFHRWRDTLPQGQYQSARHTETPSPPARNPCFARSGRGLRRGIGVPDRGEPGRTSAADVPIATLHDNGLETRSIARFRYMWWCCCSWSRNRCGRSPWPMAG
jgi:hypothetical protein